MPSLHKQLLKCKHPNSRKTKVLAKKAKQANNKQRKRIGHAIKSNIIGTKLAWFLNHLDGCVEHLTPIEFEKLIEGYLKRFEEELSQIKLRQSISKNRANQHVSRESVIRLTLEKEINEFNGGGMEMLNLCDPKQVKALREWDGNAVNVQHFKFDLISKYFLRELNKISEE